MGADERRNRMNQTPAFYIGDVPVYGDLILSPMDGYSDWPFRSLCRELGSAVSYTEFVRAEDVLVGNPQVETKLAFRKAERPVVFQIYGDRPSVILEAALRLREREPDVIDVNMGCPAKKISNRGAGVGLMRTPEKVAEIFRLLTKHLDIPVTGKIRLGWDDAHRNYLEIARIVEDNGGALLAIHARTREQGYRGQADWDAIAEVVDALSIPVVGNGDVRTVADIERMKAHTGCAAVMIGRAAMRNPWIFARRDREQVTPDEVMAWLREHLRRNLAFYGRPLGLILFRKFAVRYLDVRRLPRDLRTRLLQTDDVETFLTLVEDVLQLTHATA